MKDKLTVCDNLMAFSTIKANGNLHKRYDIFPCLRLGINNSKLQFICPNILLKLLINKLITKKCRSLFISSSEWSRHYVINFNQDHLRCSPFPHMHNKMSTKLETLNLTSTKSTTFVLKIICHHCFRRNDTDDWRIPLKFGSKWRIDAVAILKFLSSTIESYAMIEKSLSNVDDLNIEITEESCEGQANGVRQPYGIFNDKG
ncbi:hypothetical protein T08_15321 [Trichinella sp. T8]|nr:hypothetical protein T08_15321 [Trichinella sp. T8]